MKKLFLLLILIIGFNSIAQTKMPKIGDKTFIWAEKEQNKNFKINFNYLLKDYNIPQKQLDIIIMNAIIKCKFKLKNKLSFKPIEVGIINWEDRFGVIVEFSGKNEYGLDDVYLSLFSFTKEVNGYDDFTHISTEEKNTP